jgi:hypothetical protein
MNVGLTLATLVAVASLVPTFGAAAASLEVELAYEGVGADDTMGAVGPDHVVEITNRRFAVHRKSDGAVLSSVTLQGFWDAAGVSTSEYAVDPRIIYDPDSQRFFAVGLDIGFFLPNRLLLAVSNGADPQLGFTGFAIDSDSTDATAADFPTIGVDGDTVVVASDMVPAGAYGLPIAVDVLIVPKADLVGDTPTLERATFFERESINVTGFAPQPVTSPEGDGLPSWLLSSAVAFLGVVPAARIGGSTAAPTLTAGPLVLVEPLDPPPEGEQPAPGLLNTGDGHFASPVRIGDSIWAVHGVKGPSGRAAIRWFEFDATTVDVQQTGVIEDPGHDFLYPSIAANALGQVVIGFSASGADLFPSAFAVLGETVAGHTRFGEPVSVYPGAASIAGVGVLFFGDYSATVADPSDPALFWTFQDIGNTLGQGAVAIGALRVVPEPGPTASTAAAALALFVLARRRLRRSA